MTGFEVAVPYVDVLSIGVGNHIVVTCIDVAVVYVGVGCPNGYSVCVVRRIGSM